MTLPADYIAALAELGTAFTAYEAEAGHAAVLVGGAAAAIHSNGAFMSADFDVVALSDDAFASAMGRSGFVQDEHAGHGLLGWYHPEHPSYVVEQVSGGYFDGQGDLARCVRIAVRDGSEVVLPAVEDMIADRLGQHEISRGDNSMLEQAKGLFTISKGLDLTYLKTRVAQEGGNVGLLGLSGD